MSRVDGYAMLYKGETTPLFCSYCGKRLEKKTLSAGFNAFTGDEIKESWLLCPLKFENSNHSAWRDIGMTSDEYSAQFPQY